MFELLFVTFFLDKFSKKMNDELISAVLVILVLWFTNFLIEPPWPYFLNLGII